MINEIKTQKPVHESSVKNNAFIKTKIASQTVKLPAQARIKNATANTLLSLINNAGLPNDKLSATVVCLARFFSLPLKPETLTAIRRQAFTLQATPQSGELLSLAAAESKSVELLPKAFESYAEAIDPDLHKRHDEEHERKRNNQKEQKDETAHKNGQIKTVDGTSLKKLALESAENEQMLSILNRLPGKNGQRWIVLPFDFCEGGKNLRVSMRIMLERNTTVFMALDVLENKNTRISFAFEIANNKISRMTIYVSDQYAKEKTKWQTELASLLEISAERITIKKGLDNSCEANFGEDLLCSIDEAV